MELEERAAQLLRLAAHCAVKLRVEYYRGSVSPRSEYDGLIAVADELPKIAKQMEDKHCA